MKAYIYTIIYRANAILSIQFYFPRLAYTRFLLRANIALVRAVSFNWLLKV